MLINKWNLWNECRDLCFGRDSAFLAPVRYVLLVFISKRRGKKEELLTLQRLLKKVVFEPNQSSKDNKKDLSLLIVKHNRLVLFKIDGYYL